MSFGELKLWLRLPVEIRLLVLSELDAMSWLAFSKVDPAVSQDNRLCKFLLEKHFPLAAARARSEIKHRSASPKAFFERLISAIHLQYARVNRRCTESFELLPPKFTPEGYDAWHARVACDFGRLLIVVRYAHKVLLTILNSEPRQVELDMPPGCYAKDTQLEEESIFVLCGHRGSVDVVLQFDFQGKLIGRFETGSAIGRDFKINRQFIVIHHDPEEPHHGKISLVKIRHAPRDHKDFGKVQMMPTPDVPRYDCRIGGLDDEHLYLECQWSAEGHGIHVCHVATSTWLTFHRNGLEHFEVQISNRHCYKIGQSEVALICGQEVTSVPMKIETSKGLLGRDCGSGPTIFLPDVAGLLPFEAGTIDELCKNSHLPYPDGPLLECWTEEGERLESPDHWKFSTIFISGSRSVWRYRPYFPIWGVSSTKGAVSNHQDKQDLACIQRLSELLASLFAYEQR